MLLFNHNRHRHMLLFKYLYNIKDITCQNRNSQSDDRPDVSILLYCRATAKGDWPGQKAKKKKNLEKRLMPKSINKLYNYGLVYVKDWFKRNQVIALDMVKANWT